MQLIWAKGLSILKGETLVIRCYSHLRRPASCNRSLFQCILLTQHHRDLGLWARTSKRTVYMVTSWHVQRSPQVFRWKQNLKIAQELRCQIKKAWCSRASWRTRYRVSPITSLMRTVMPTSVLVELLRSVHFLRRRIQRGHLIQCSGELLKKENRPKPRPVFSTQHPVTAFQSAQASLKALNIDVDFAPKTKNLASWTT